MLDAFHTPHKCHHTRVNREKVVAGAWPPAHVSGNLGAPAPCIDRVDPTCFGLQYEVPELSTARS